MTLRVLIGIRILAPSPRGDVSWRSRPFYLHVGPCLVRSYGKKPLRQGRCVRLAQWSGVLSGKDLRRLAVIRRK
jgi:hypothetical protein